MSLECACYVVVTSVAGVDPIGAEAGGIGQPLVTDRPDFTESTDAVPHGAVQFELGYTFTHDRERGVRNQTHGAPELLLRAGLMEDFELRIGWSGYVWTRTATPDERADNRLSWSQSPTDMTLGFKLKVSDQWGWRPHLGIVVETTLPTAGRGSSSGDVDPTVRFLWGYDLDDRFLLAGNINVGVPTEDGSRFVQTSASISLGVALDARWGAYTEYFGFYNNSHHGDAAHYLNGGFTYLVNDDFQWDVRVGVGLNEEADDFVTGFGFAFRF